MKNGLMINYTDVAAFLVHEDDTTQAAFLSTFAEELRRVCKTHHHTSTQMAAIVSKLSDQDIETLWLDIA